MWKRKVVLCCVVTLLLTGCWSRIEVNDLGVVLGMAVDVGETERVRVSLFMARSLGAGTASTSQNTAPVWVVAREGHNENEAMAKIARESSRRLSLHHLRVVLVSEELARISIRGLEDFLARNPQVRMTLRPFVVRGRAQQVLETLPNLAELQPTSLVELLDATGAPKHSFKDVLVARTSLTHSAWMHGLQILPRMGGLPEAPEEIVSLNGVALFRGDRLVGWLNSREALGMYWLLGEGKETAISAPCPGETAHTLSARTLESHAQVHPHLKGNQVSFDVALRAQIELVRVACKQEAMTDPARRSKVSQYLDELVVTWAQEAIAQFQATQTDPVGFGKRLELAHPAYWNQIKERWPELWLETKVKVTAELRLQNAGLLSGSPTDTEVELRKQQE